MSIFLSDEFTGTAAAELSAYNPNWVMVGGTTGIFVINANGGSVNANSAGGTAVYYRADAESPSPDYSVSADITFAGAVPSGPAIGIIGRASNSANTHYEARFVSLGSSTGNWQLRRIVAGVATTLGTIAGAYTVGQTVRLSLKMALSEISLHLDNSPTPLLGPITDTAITAPGYAGLRGLNALSTRFRADNFVASTLEAAGEVTTTTVSPVSANLTVTGYAPSMAQSADKFVSPAPAALIVRGDAPTISQVAAGTRVISPAPADLVVRGFSPTVTQTGQQPAQSSATGGGGGVGSVREVRDFADELDRAAKPTKAQKRRRRQAIEAAVLELLPDEPAAARIAPVLAQIVARELPPATWAPIRPMQPITLPPAVVDEVRARVDRWLIEQMLLAELEDEFETELLLLG